MRVLLRFRTTCFTKRRLASAYACCSAGEAGGVGRWEEEEENRVAQQRRPLSADVLIIAIRMFQNIRESSDGALAWSSVPRNQAALAAGDYK